MRTLVLTMFLAFAAGCEMVAAVVVRPANPNATDTLQATIDVTSACDATAETVVAGNVVRTTVTFDQCAPLPPFELPITETFGPLPSGIYTYEVYFLFAGEPPATLEASQTLTIAAAPVAAAPAVPALGAAGAILLTLAAAAVGALTLRRVA